MVYSMPFEIQISLELLDCLRQFQHEANAFQYTFLHDLDTILAKCTQHTHKALNIGDLSFEAVYLGLHYYLSLIGNLDELVSKLDGNARIRSLNVQSINSTNIFSFQCLLNTLQARRTANTQGVSLERYNDISEQTPYQEDGSDLIPENLIQSLRIYLVEDDLKSDTVSLSLPIHLVSFMIKSDGRFDAEFVALICQNLNKSLGLNLAHYLLPTTTTTTTAPLISNNNTRTLPVSPTCKKENWYSEKDLQTHIGIFLEEKNPDVLLNVLESLENIIRVTLQYNDKPSLNLLKRLFIGLLGHSNCQVRERSVACLNILGDGIEWQFERPHKAQIRVVGDEFVVCQCLETTTVLDTQSLVLQLYSLPFDSSAADPVLSWHKPEVIIVPNTVPYVVVKVDLGLFPRAGFYDWKLVKLNSNGSVQDLNNNIEGAIQGRYIVHPKDTRELGIHEIAVDNLTEAPGSAEQGSFSVVKEKLAHYARAGINCIYIMGALERHCPQGKKGSPLAITCRKSVSSTHGGWEEFRELTETACRLKIKIVVDCVSKVSSVRPHKRYRNLMLREVDEEGRLVSVYGGEGKGLKYEETSYLNYRKKEAWDLLIEEAVELVKRHGISGLNLDDVANWPQIFDVNSIELSRKLSDGTEAYSVEERFYGEVIHKMNPTGYWYTTKAQNTYANPFLVEFCRRMWQEFPSLLLIGEMWNAPQAQDKQSSIVNSGIIPRLYQFQSAIANAFGKSFNKFGVLQDTTPSCDSILKLCQEADQDSCLPSGAIVIQSTSGHRLPYPSFLCKQRVWNFIDLVFFLPAIPMTFMGEIDGYAHRSETIRILDSSMMEGDDIIPLFEDDERLYNGEDRINASIGVVDRSAEFWEKERNFKKEMGSEYGFDMKRISYHYAQRRYLRKSSEALRAGKLLPLCIESKENPGKKIIGFARVAAMETVMVAINPNEYDVHFTIDTRDINHVFKELNQDALEYSVVQIQDYNKTGGFPVYYTAYEFLFGKIEMSLKPYDSLVWRVSVIYNDKDLYNTTIQTSLQKLKYNIMKNQPIQGHEIIELLIKLVKDSDNPQDFARNLDYIHKKFLKPAGISVPHLFNCIKKVQENPSLSEKLFALCMVLKEQIPQLSEGDTASSSNDTDDIPKGLTPPHTSKQEQEDITSLDLEAREELKSGVEIARDILEHNTLGPVALITPELGRWSTVGGLGVMVDELSIGIAQSGQEVICISPYYDRNRKGETGYLAKDPDGIRYVFNIEVDVGGEKFILGVHYAVIKGVTLYFMHHAMIFPHIYVGGDAKYTTLQMTLMAKASLQLLCTIARLPSLVVTNDWFTGFVAAFARSGQFGRTFEQTKFLHILHNLDPAYEGRQYPHPDEGIFEYMHGLPSYLLVNPQWSDKIINPSRCAILCSDVWATVSKTYMKELLAKSPLADVLKQCPNPFAVSNGILKEARLQKIAQVCNNDHLKAKEAIQKKYFKFPKLDNSYAILAFVGRITYQKGVHIILEAIEDLLHKFDLKIQFIIGGMVSVHDPYGSSCADMMRDLMHKYPDNVWASPYEFFTDGTLLNAGADFGLMPSLFEPGGIVQHEFFVGSTPVIASQTGGLQDTVFEFDSITEKGNGFVLSHTDSGNLIAAVTRALEVYRQSKKYQTLRQNAFDSVVDVKDVAKAWNLEFHSIFNKLMIDYDAIKPYMDTIEKSVTETAPQEKPSLSQFAVQKILEEILPRRQAIHGADHKTVSL